ncbi:hypothetical protein LSG31_00595 [Fodinisporobacter ferrooxydans]|uniref:Uncharacterized protein n=1 Tax=Fodinisporobacter ferrooxydans TaxID=2901836 RepID=A0ABY4CMZ6_9BACL|nr:hypothetical protein LSG31_00595 [Alicyclobacillaceae bacterium MYW30-H2]
MKKWSEMTEWERDALVAEKVMGFTVYSYDKDILLFKAKINKRWTR